MGHKKPINHIIKLQPCFENNKVFCIRTKWPDVKCSSITRHENIFYSKGNPYFSTWNSVKRISPRVSLHYGWDFWRSKVSSPASAVKGFFAFYSCAVISFCFQQGFGKFFFATYEITCVAQGLIFFKADFLKVHKKFGKVFV